MTQRRHTTIDTELDELTVVAEDEYIVGVYFPGHWTRPNRADFGDRAAGAADALLSRAARQLTEYLTGRRQDFDLPVRTSGDAFQERVWALLRTIPYGQTTSYGAIATELGDRLLAQRVGHAVGHNPVGIVIPCHRVIGADGSLTGYAGGLERKRRLLEIEEPAAVAAGRLF